MEDYYRSMANIQNAAMAREADRHAAQVALPSLLSGGATWLALKRAIHDLVGRAPKDHDVLILIGDVAVMEAEFIEPHSFLFHGINQDGHRTVIVAHYTQVWARVIYRPKQGPSRVITGFTNEPSA